MLGSPGLKSVESTERCSEDIGEWDWELRQPQGEAKPLVLPVEQFVCYPEKCLRGPSDGSGNVYWPPELEACMGQFYVHGVNISPKSQTFLLRDLGL